MSESITAKGQKVKVEVRVFYKRHQECNGQGFYVDVYTDTPETCDGCNGTGKVLLGKTARAL